MQQTINKLSVSIAPKRMTAAIIAALFILALSIPLIRFTQSVSAIEDTTPMQLVDLQVDTNSVDTSSGPAEVNITGEVFEDQSGFNTIEFIYTSPSGGQVIVGDANSDPEFIDEYIEFPQYSEAGVWRGSFTLYDEAQNVVTHDADDLANMGFDVDITVTSTPTDVLAPTISSVVIGAASVDTSSGPATVPVTVYANDALSGISQFGSTFASFISPSGQQVGTTLIHVTGNEYVANVPFRQYGEAGTWELEVHLQDNTSNTALYDAADLQALSLPYSVLVTGTSDTTPVSIDSLNFAAAIPPPGFSNGGPVITVDGFITDNLSGVGSADLVYKSQTSTQEIQAFVSNNVNDYTYVVAFSEFAALGDWLPEFSTTDYAGNTQVYTHNDLLALGFDMTINFLENESDTVAAGGTVTTDTDSNGATASDQFEAELTSPVAGLVKIQETELVNPISSNEILLFDKQYDITAPAATPQDPLLLTFTIDSTGLQGQNESTVIVFRNGSVVPECTHATEAVPDPCVADRTTLGDGDVQLTVRTSEASIWVFGFEETSGTNYSFKRFKKPIKKAPKMNVIEERRVIPVKFRLNNESSRLDVLGAHVASSQKINCQTKEVIGNLKPIKLAKNGDLKIKPNGVYKFKWKTLKRWDNTCRQLVLEFDNGEVATANFKFKY